MNIRNFSIFVIGTLLLFSLIRVIGCTQAQDAGATTSLNATSTSTTTAVTGTTVLSGYRYYYPNNDGYSWTYSRIFSDQPQPMTERITYAGYSQFHSSQVQIARREVFELDGSVTTIEGLFKVDNYAVYRVEDVLSTPTLIAVFGFPLRVGIRSGVTDVLALEDVNTPAGLFINCFKLSTTDAGITYLSWLAPNVGLVRAEKITATEISTAELTAKNF